MAIIKYRTDRFFLKIDEVEIIRETNSCVFFRDFIGKEIRKPKKSDYICFHDSWQEAHAYLVTRTERKIKQAKERLEIEEKALKTILDMKPE